MERENFLDVIRKIPKAEIHLHLEDFIIEQLEEFGSLPEFLTEVRLAQNSRKELCDFDRVFKRLARYMVTNGIVYAEVFFSVPRYLNNGLVYSEMIKHFGQQIKRIKEKNLTVKLLADLSRTYGVESASTVLDLVIKHKNKNVIGIGLGGDEKAGPAADYVEIFKRAREHGLHTVAHAGEYDSSKSVIDTVELLAAERIGHGVAIMQDADAIKLLCDRQIPIEVQPTSNTITGHFVKKLEDHPVKMFWDKGLFITLNSDDPNLFNTSLIKEYWNLYSKLGFEMENLRRIIINGFKASFLSESQKQEYIKMVNKQWHKMLIKEQNKDKKTWHDICQNIFERMEC